jgi:DNA polymerase/3'-5' exonuclease PolX
MGGVALAGKRVSLAEGHKVAKLAMGDIAGCYQTAFICGSIRRERPDVGDVDIVVVGNQYLNARLVELCGVQKNGKPKKKYLLNGVQIDFYLADSSDLGAQLLMWTGSKTFNIRCRREAKIRDILLNQYGAWFEGRRIAGETEGDVLATLGMQYIEPKDRE